MNYEETIAYLFNNLPYYQDKGLKAFKPGLQNIRLLDEQLGHPHKSYSAIHVAGTNGKGSVSHILAAVLQAAGYKTGLYTSPHLTDFRERIKVDGIMVSRYFVTGFVNSHQSLFNAIQPSFFEITVAMALSYFAEQQVDMAIIEVGLGGRLDSTNIITPLVSIITSISLDHTQLLGNTLASIAGEKAGIIKKGTPVVIGESNPETKPVFEEAAFRNQAPVVFAGERYRFTHMKGPEPGTQLITIWESGEPENQLIPIFESGEPENQPITIPGKGTLLYEKLLLDLSGAFQGGNLVTALCALEQLNNKGHAISGQHIRTGCRDIRKRTGFQGRWQVLRKHPLVIADIAHNYEGLRLNLLEMEPYPAENRHFILGFTKEKDVPSLLTLFPKASRYYFTRARLDRAMHEEELHAAAVSAGLSGNTFPSVMDAFQDALYHASEDDLIYIGGSTFIVSELI